GPYPGCGVRREGRSAPVAHTPVAPDGARTSAREAVRANAPSLREEGDLGRRDELDLSDHALPARVTARAARSPPHRIAPYTERIVRLERLDRRVHRVRHVGVHGGE